VGQNYAHAHGKAPTASSAQVTLPLTLFSSFDASRGRVISQFVAESKGGGGVQEIRAQCKKKRLREIKVPRIRRRGSLSSQNLEPKVFVTPYHIQVFLLSRIAATLVNIFLTVTTTV
jgi:hypothetical protein